jgi:hypothetical protein
MVALPTTGGCWFGDPVLIRAPDSHQIPRSPRQAKSSRTRARPVSCAAAMVTRASAPCPRARAGRSSLRRVRREPAAALQDAARPRTARHGPQNAPAGPRFSTGRAAPTYEVHRPQRGPRGNAPGRTRSGTVMPNFARVRASSTRSSESQPGPEGTPREPAPRAPRRGRQRPHGVHAAPGTSPASLPPNEAPGARRNGLERLTALDRSLSATG